MKSFINQLKSERTHQSKPNLFRSISTNINTVKSDNQDYSYVSSGFNEKYILTGHIGCAFYANQGTYDEALECAKAHMVDFLYRDVKSCLYQIMNDIHSGDREAALESCLIMRDLITYN